MSVTTMFDLLSNATADYSTTTLSVNPNRMMHEQGRKKQRIIEADDDTTVVVELSTGVTFYVMLIWEKRKATDMESIFDLYFDTNKADGMKNTFQWEHPTDGHTYVVRFATQLDRKRYVASQGFGTVRLKVEGRIAEA